MTTQNVYPVPDVVQGKIQNKPVEASQSSPLSWREHPPIHFPSQRPDEHVILLLRRHWSVIAGAVLKLVALILLPPVVLVVIFFTTSFTYEHGSPLAILLVEGVSLFYLFSFLSYFHDFVDYHLDIWVVTDQRIVSIEQEGLFKRVIAELNILRVQDVTSEIHGKVRTFLNYGDVHIQTAGEKERFIFEQVPKPSEVAKIILQAHDRAIKKHKLEEIRLQETYRQQSAHSQPQ